MILNLIEGISNTLQEKWDISVKTDSLKNVELEKPYFLINIPSSEEKTLMGNRCVRQIQVDIKYYPDETKEASECYEVAEQLYDLMDIVLLPDESYARGQNKKFEFTDGVIIFHTDFDFIMTVEKIKDEENVMGTINNQTGLVSI